jgi:hypothetical protein
VVGREEMMVMMVIDGDVLAGRSARCRPQPGCWLTQQGCSRAIYTLSDRNITINHHHHHHSTGEAQSVEIARNA